MHRYKQNILALLIIWLVFSANAALASPSEVKKSGGTAVWTIGTTTIWEFPKAREADAKKFAERFDALYKKGFLLTDLRVTKTSGNWTLFVGNSVVGSAQKAYDSTGKTNEYHMSLHWLSALYEAMGRMHAAKPDSKTLLKGSHRPSGQVSWYGGKFIGRKCSNGETLTETLLGVAAKDLPFGTLVKVTVPATGKSVTARVTDRFGEHKGRILDLAHACAEITGIKRMGIADVRVEIIGKVDRVGGK